MFNPITKNRLINPAPTPTSTASPTQQCPRSHLSIHFQTPSTCQPRPPPTPSTSHPTHLRTPSTPTPFRLRLSQSLPAISPISLLLTAPPRIASPPATHLWGRATMARRRHPPSLITLDDSDQPWPLLSSPAGPRRDGPAFACASELPCPCRARATCHPKKENARPPHVHGCSAVDLLGGGVVMCDGECGCVQGRVIGARIHCEAKG